MSSLWRGRDHLVYVRGSGFLIPFTEDYKRYRFEDIQAFAVSKKSRVGMAAVHGLSVLFFFGLVALILALSDPDSFGIGAGIWVSILAVCGLVSLSLLVRHLILGPPCLCHIQTGLSHDRLRPLNRFLLAREVVDGLEEEIRRRQAEVIGEISASPQSEDGLISTGEAPNRGREVGLRSRSAPPSVSSAMFPGFALAFLFGLLGLGALNLEMLALVLVELFLFLLLGLSLILALVAAMRRTTPQSIRSWLWALLGLTFAFGGVAVVYLFLAAARDPAYTLEFTGPLEAYMGVATEGGPVFYFLFLGNFLALIVGGVGGSIDAVRWRAKLNREEADEGRTNPTEGESEHG